MQRWTPRDVVALVMIVGAFALRAIGVNHVTEWVIVGVGGGYLGLGVATGVTRVYRESRRAPRAQKEDTP